MKKICFFILLPVALISQVLFSEYSSEEKMMLQQMYANELWKNGRNVEAEFFASLSAPLDEITQGFYDELNSTSDESAREIIINKIKVATGFLNDIQQYSNAMEERAAYLNLIQSEIEKNKKMSFVKLSTFNELANNIGNILHELLLSYQDLVKFSLLTDDFMKNVSILSQKKKEVFENVEKLRLYLNRESLLYAMTNEVFGNAVKLSLLANKNPIVADQAEAFFNLIFQSFILSKLSMYNPLYISSTGQTEKRNPIGSELLLNWGPVNGILKLTLFDQELMQQIFSSIYNFALQNHGSYRGSFKDELVKYVVNKLDGFRLWHTNFKFYSKEKIAKSLESLFRESLYPDIKWNIIFQGKTFYKQYFAVVESSLKSIFNLDLGDGKNIQDFALSGESDFGSQFFQSREFDDYQMIFVNNLVGMGRIMDKLNSFFIFPNTTDLSNTFLYDPVAYKIIFDFFNLINEHFEMAFENANKFNAIKFMDFAIRSVSENGSLIGSISETKRRINRYFGDFDSGAKEFIRAPLQLDRKYELINSIATKLMNFNFGLFESETTKFLQKYKEFQYVNLDRRNTGAVFTAELARFFSSVYPNIFNENYKENIKPLYEDFARMSNLVIEANEMLDGLENDQDQYLNVISDRILISPRYDELIEINNYINGLLKNRKGGSFNINDLINAKKMEEYILKQYVDNNFPSTKIIAFAEEMIGARRHSLAGMYRRFEEIRDRGYDKLKDSYFQRFLGIVFAILLAEKLSISSDVSLKEKILFKELLDFSSNFDRDAKYFFSTFKTFNYGKERSNMSKFLFELGAQKTNYLLDFLIEGHKEELMPLIERYLDKYMTDKVVFAELLFKITYYRFLNLLLKYPDSELSEGEIKKKINDIFSTQKSRFAMNIYPSFKKIRRPRISFGHRLIYA